MQVLTYIDVSAVSEGISDQLAFYLLSIANACSAIGRIVGGLVADKTGQFFSISKSHSSLNSHGTL